MPNYLFRKLLKRVIGHLISFADNILVSYPSTGTSILLSTIKMKRKWQKPLELQEYVEKMFLSVSVEIIYYPVFVLI